MCGAKECYICVRKFVFCFCSFFCGFALFCFYLLRVIFGWWNGMSKHQSYTCIYIVCRHRWCYQFIKMSVDLKKYAPSIYSTMLANTNQSTFSYSSTHITTINSISCSNSDHISLYVHVCADMKANRWIK